METGLGDGIVLIKVRIAIAERFEESGLANQMPEVPMKLGNAGILRWARILTAIPASKSFAWSIGNSSSFCHEKEIFDDVSNDILNSERRGLLYGK